MNEIFLGGALAVAVLLMALRVPIALVLACLSFVSTFFFFFLLLGGGLGDVGSALDRTTVLLTSNAFSFFHSYTLSMVPLFIGVGHVAQRAGITSDIYSAVRAWTGRVPGGLAIASVAGCAGFAAVSGSSVACASAMGRICVPEMVRRGYNPGLSGAAVAYGGTLGALIPPSILFIFYGIFTEQSISRLFVAGILPGLISFLGIAATILIVACIRPQLLPRAYQGTPFAEKARKLLAIWPAIGVFLIVVGGLYGGMLTATEVAAVTLVFITGYAVLAGRLKLADLWQVTGDTVKESSAVLFLAAAAKLFVAFVALTGVTESVTAWMQGLDLSWVLTVICICLLYVVLGMFLDPLGIMILTLPFVVPLVEQHHIDLIWFGVIVIKLLEVGLVTPPVGLNVFVVAKSAAGFVSTGKIFLWISIFLLMEILIFGLLMLFPDLATFLPDLMNA